MRYGEQNLVYPGNNGIIMKRRISEKNKEFMFILYAFPRHPPKKSQEQKKKKVDRRK